MEQRPRGPYHHHHRANAPWRVAARQRNYPPAQKNSRVPILAIPFPRASPRSKGGDGNTCSRAIAEELCEKEDLPTQDRRHALRSRQHSRHLPPQPPLRKAETHLFSRLSPSYLSGIRKEQQMLRQQGKNNIGRKFWSNNSRGPQ